MQQYLLTGFTWLDPGGQCQLFGKNVHDTHTRLCSLFLVVCQAVPECYLGTMHSTMAGRQLLYDECLHACLC